MPIVENLKESTSNVNKWLLLKIHKEHLKLNDKKINNWTKK